MKIAIDVTTLQARSKTGLWAYTEGMVKALSNVDSQDLFFLLGRGLRVNAEDLRVSIGANFKKVILRIPDRRFWGEKVIWNDFALPFFCSLNGIDLLWIPAGHWVPKGGGFKRVLTIHDLRSIHLKDNFLRQDIEGLMDAVKRADCIVCISEFTKQDVIEHLAADESKVRIVYNGVDRIERVKEEDVLVSWRSRMGLTREFFFCLGMVPRKNVKRSLKAFCHSGLWREMDFVFAGTDGGILEEYKQLAEDLGIGKSVKFWGIVDEESLRFLYSSATAFVFPSLFEGFGLPVLEAQMCGCPVIASNVSALPEVLGDSSLLVDPYSVQDISLAMDRIVRDEKLRRVLIIRGYENVKRFSWEKSARALLGVFRELV